MASSLLLLLDVVLATMLVATCLRVLLARDLFQSVVLFIVFGMLLGIAWCRLAAVDVALAEVAIGAGVTGALLLNTLAATRRQSQRLNQETWANQDYALAGRTMSSRAPIVRASAVVAFVGMFIGGLATVVVPLALAASAQRIAIAEALPHSGVSNPVTAVLLNFRAHDTLLEVAVLMAAVLAVLVVSTNAGRTGARPVGPVLGSFVELLVPLAILVAVYVLSTGTKAPGGAFQAAAILGAAGVLTIVCGGRSPLFARRHWRVLLVGGPAAFLLVGLGGVAAGGRFLELSPRWAGASIMLVELALTASIALVLVLLFGGATSSVDENDIAAGEQECAAAVDATDSGANDTQEQSP